MRPLRMAKGHGTENDFVLLDDPAAELDLTAQLVSALCHRRSGIGGDGVIRVARTEALVAAGALADLDAVPGGGTGPDGRVPEWFMDYRNSDGSVVEMCGNGARVFAAYLLRHGLVASAAAAGGSGAGVEFAIGTRGGVRRIRWDDGLIAVDLGPWRVTAGGDLPPLDVHLPGEPALPGVGVDVGNPHVVVALPARAELARVDLSVPPRVAGVAPGGVNVEVVTPVHGPAGAGHLLMRVRERGSGETRSCGTGAAASAVAARVWAGPQAPLRWWVDVPGGRLRVDLTPEPLHGPGVVLAGPAVIVADGVVDARWLAEATGTVEPAGAAESVGPLSRST